MIGLSPTRKLTRLARWGLIGTVVLMGAALVATLWTTRRGVGEASETVIRGQSVAFFSALRPLMGRGRPEPSQADLDAVLAQYEADGLRYVGRFAADGSPVAAAGTPLYAGAPTAGERRQRVGDRVRVVFGRPDPDRDGGHRRPMTVIEFVPTVADQLRADADRSFAIGAVVAGILMLIAIALVRWFLRQQALERQLARERRLASLGEMSAVLAHEIRNPIASLKGNAQLLVKMLPDEGKPRSKAERLVGESVRLESLTEDLLEFARAGELSREQVDPAALVRELATGDVAVDTGTAPASWSLDPRRMRQVLTNLIENAREAGGPVEVRVDGEPGALIVTVRDHGAGIASADLDRLFEPFFTKKSRGTGLGLAVARRIVELHGGSLTASNHPAGGAELCAVIPEE